MRFGALIVLLAGTIACSTGLWQPYEYEEELYLSLDGRATLYVNSSVAALNALRGTTFDSTSAAPVDTAALRAFFSTPATRVERVTQSQRRGRRFVHVRLDVADVSRLGHVPPFSWSSYRLTVDGNPVVYVQQVGMPSPARTPPVAWGGDEIIAFRVHIPSKVQYHNAGADNLRRGNILVWEQPLGDRLAGVPLVIEARMDPESILYRTLWLFVSAGAAVATVFAILLWLLLRSGRKAAPLSARRWPPASHPGSSADGGAAA